MMKRIGIEALLRWAFCEELPKAGSGRSKLTGVGFGNAWRSILGFGDLLAVVDDEGRNRFGVIADPNAEGEPHPDAIAVHDAVRALDDMEIELPEGWDPLADLDDIDAERPGLIARALAHVSVIDAEGVRRMKGSVSAIVIRQAILGGTPVWEAEQPERRFVLGANGRPAWFRTITVETEAGPITSEVDGYDAKGKRPMAGAYRKTFLDPDPAEAALGRAEYEIWRFALDVLVERLAGLMDAHEATPSERAWRPWEEAPELAPRVLPSLTAAPACQPPIRPGRRKRLAA
jgi:hypothetical protein